MKFKTLNFCLALTLVFFGFQKQKDLPEGFVYVKSEIPDIDVELRYYSVHNFVGDTIDGYKSNTLILTKAATEKLKLVQDELQTQNLCLKVFDGYRPQRAVNHFIRWARKRALL